MGTLTIGQGEAYDPTLQAHDLTGNTFSPITNPSPFDGTETLATRVWAGGTLATMFSPTTTWVDATTAAYQISFVSADTVAVPTGVYYLQTTVTKAGKTGNLNQGVRLRVTAAPGTDVSAEMFTNLPDLLKYCPWLEDLQTPSDEWGFLAQQIRATNHMVDTLCQLYKTSNLSPTIGQPGWNASTLYGPMRTPPSFWLRAQLVPLPVDSLIPAKYANLRMATNANHEDPTLSTCLLLYDEVKEICAKWAISYVLAAQMGRNDDKQWTRLQRGFLFDANGLFQSRQFEIDLSVPQTGWASITIPGNGSNVR